MVVGGVAKQPPLSPLHCRTPPLNNLPIYKFSNAFGHRPTTFLNFLSFFPTVYDVGHLNQFPSPHFALPSSIPLENFCSIPGTSVFPAFSSESFPIAVTILIEYATACLSVFCSKSPLVLLPWSPHITNWPPNFPF
jgi:hypothetical protein